MKLFRAMKLDEKIDKPKIGDTANELGVRINGDYKDIELRDNFIPSDDGGMSVSPNSKNLPEHRKKRNPIWKIDSENLAQFGLIYCEDKPDKHGLIKPIKSMKLSDYKHAIEQTQQYWQKV